MNEDDEYYELYEEELSNFAESLPKVVRSFQESALEVSHMNDVPAAVSFFVVLGQVVKDFVLIPNGRNIEDSRIHFGWIQTSGTGKSTLWNFVGPVAKETFIKINEKGHHPKMQSEIGDATGQFALPQNFNTFSLTDYTDATLIGGFNKSTNDEGEDEMIRIPGHFEGAGLAHWDEFEYSGVFKPTQHNESSIVYLNTLMNTLAGESWVISKALRQFDNEIMYCYSQRSVLAMTYPPDNLSDVIANKGVLQRMLLFIWDVPEHIQDQMREEQIDKAGTIEIVNQPIDKYANAFFKLYELMYDRYNEVGQDPLKTMTFASGFNDALKHEYNEMKKFINNTNADVRRVAQNFTTRLLKILIKMSVLCSIAEAPNIPNKSDRFVVRVKNVNQAAIIVRQCYNTLVTWLEQGLRVRRRTLEKKSLYPTFVKVYGELCAETGDDYISKKELLSRVVKEGQKSQTTVYEYFKKIKNKFLEQKQGRVVFLKLVGDEK